MKRKFIKLIKGLIVFILLMNFSTPAFLVSAEEVKPFECEITFDWISKSQLQRDENISQIQKILFQDNGVVKYSKKEFNKKYFDFLKNKDYLLDYEEISKGKKEDTEKNYCGFYVGKVLIAYGIQYKNNPKIIYYYDALGNLRWVDSFSENYPNFPYWSYQYYRNGKLVAAYYYTSEYDQYVFDENKKFKGRWYKEKMYNKNAKVIMTRTNW